MVKQCLLLFSGGIDSTACLYFYISMGFHVKPVFFDYGQSASKNEKESVSLISEYYKVKPQIIDISSLNSFNVGEIAGRNAFLILSTIMANPNFFGTISMGIHSGTPYYDCSELFMNDVQKVLDGYFSGKVILEAPFLNWNKKMIYQYCKDNDVPLEKTYSCERGGKEPCGKCLSCLDRSSLSC